MATSIFKGAAGRSVSLSNSKLTAGSLVLTIQAKDGADMCISLTPHVANMLANAIEFEAVNGHALELKAGIEAAVNA